MSFSDENPDALLAGPAQRAAWSSVDLGRVVGALRHELIEQGFEAEQVWELCREYFMQMVSPACGEEE